MLGFELVENKPASTYDGRPKRWVVVRPPGAETGLLLARAGGERQAAIVGDQHAGRVGFFLQVDDFDAEYRRMRDAGVEFVKGPITEDYGRERAGERAAGERAGERAVPVNVLNAVNVPRAFTPTGPGERAKGFHAG